MVVTARPHANSPHQWDHGPLHAHGVVRRGFRPRPGLTGVGGGAVVAVAEGPVAALVSVPHRAHGHGGPADDGGCGAGDVSSTDGVCGVCGAPEPSRAAESPAAPSAAVVGPSDTVGSTTGTAPQGFAEDVAQAAADAHRRVVDEAAATVCVLPLRLGTVHRDEAEVRRALAERAGLYEQLLTRLDGRLEWGVKAYADEVAGSGAAGSATEAVTGGTEYAADRLARAAHEALADVSECSRVFHPQDSGPARGAAASAYWTSPISAAPYPHGRKVLDSAYLVPREEAGAFAETVGGVVARCPELHIELTGPWAPYSFAEPDRLPDLPDLPG